MDSTDDTSSSAMKISSPDHNSNMNSIVLPPAFVSDPAGFLTSIASRPSPSREGISLLSGPLSSWFQSAAENRRQSNSANSAMMTGQSVHPASHVAQLYLSAAATQLREEPSQAVGMSTLAAATMASNSAMADIATAAFSREQSESKSQIAKDRDEILEAVSAAAVLCSDRSAISSSGILPVLAKLLMTADSPASAATSSNNKITSSIATSLLNMPSSSSKAFPPLTLAHVAFLQCAVVGEMHEYAESVVRGTWPLPTSTLKNKYGNGESHPSVSIIMKYYYLRGIVHYACGRDHYALAHRCWWTCLSIPVDTVSTTAIQAWKKLSLVQPLLDIDINNRERREISGADMIDLNNDGNSNVKSTDALATSSLGKKNILTRPGTRLPKCTPKGLSKSIRSLIDSTIGKNKGESSQADLVASPEKDLYSVYTHLGPAVEAVDRTTVENLVRMHGRVLAADGNMGMARNCLQRVKELQVEIASTIFSVTSIQILARRWNVTPEEASNQLSDAVKLGVTPCRVEEDGTVVFLPPTGNTENNTRTNLTDLTAWMKLLEQLQQMDVNLSISSKYNSVKRKDEKGMSDEPIVTTGPRGVAEFYSDPAM